MADPYVRDVGTVQDIDEAPVVLGVDYDTVPIGIPGHPLKWQFHRAEAEEFVQLFVACSWEAGANATRMRADAAADAADEPGGSDA